MDTAFLEPEEERTAVWRVWYLECVVRVTAVRRTDTPFIAAPRTYHTKG